MTTTAVKASTSPIDRIFPLLKGVKELRSGKPGYQAICPAHRDTQPSLTVWEDENDHHVGIHCYASCSRKAVCDAWGIAETDLYIQDDRVKQARADAPHLTMFDLAADKEIHPNDLERLQLGITDNHPYKGGRVVHIPYFHEDGTKHTRYRIRTHASAKKGSTWNTNSKDALLPYGLQRLQLARKEKYLLLVEGESDCWTLWGHGFQALGIPGAQQESVLQVNHLSEIERLYIVQEPDEAGRNFVTDMKNHLATIGYNGNVYHLDFHKLTGAKDPNDLHKLHKTEHAQFKRLIKLAIEQADLLPRSFNRTDLGNAERLVAWYGKDLRYCYEMESWLVWNGSHWQEDTGGQAERIAKKAVRHIYAEASTILDEADRKAMAAHAVRSESKKAIRDMLTLAQSEEQISVSGDSLDSDPWLLNCSNGTLDLQTGQLHRHNRADLITRCIPAAYKDDAQCPLWNSFLLTIFDGNTTLIQFMQRALGYALSGDISEQVFFLLWGKGQNGKSTMLETVQKLLGDYAQSAPFESFLAKKHDGIRNDIARMKGKRMVIAKESDKGKRLSEAMVKQITGADTLTARFLHKEFFDFMPQFKLFLAANDKPTIKGTDTGIWRRVRLIPFTVTIPDEQKDTGLSHKLAMEAEGILAWVVAGCLDWQKNGLGLPDEVKKATGKYRSDMDIVGTFLSEECEIGDKSPESDCKAGVKILAETFETWCKSEGEYPDAKRLHSALVDMGLLRNRSTGGITVWRGIKLREVNSEVVK